MSEYFQEQRYLAEKVKVELYLTIYALKTDFDATGVDTSSLARKVDLAHLKSNVDRLYTDKLKNVPNNLSNLKGKVDKLDVDKLVPVPANLSKLNDAVKKDVVKKNLYNAKIKKILKIKYLLL